LKASLVLLGWAIICHFFSFPAFCVTQTTTGAESASTDLSTDSRLNAQVDLSLKCVSVAKSLQVMGEYSKLRLSVEPAFELRRVTVFAKQQCLRDVMEGIAAVT